MNPKLRNHLSIFLPDIQPVILRLHRDIFDCGENVLFTGKILKEKNITKDKYEFQMLYGVKESLRDRINKDGHKIRVYVPFGEHWYKYSIRRLQENPNMAWYIVKSLFSFN